MIRCEDHLIHLPAKLKKILHLSQDYKEDRFRGALLWKNQNRDCTHYLINTKLYLWNTFFNLFDFLQLGNFVFTMSSKMSWCVSQDVLVCIPRCFGVWKCFRKASIYRSLGVGKQYMAESDWWHMSQFDWRIFKTFSPRHVISFDWPKCLDFQCETCQQLIRCLCHHLHASDVIAYTCQMSLLTLTDLWQVILLTRAVMWLAFCILFFFLMFLFPDTWQISVGSWMVMVETSCSTWRFVIGCTLWTS